MSQKYDNCENDNDEDDFNSEEFEQFYRSTPLNDETTCGMWMFKGPKLQRLANKKVLLIIFGIGSCFFTSTFSYFNGTITTMEKLFKIPSKITSFIVVGNDVGKLGASIVLNYYASRGHRPRWIAIGLYFMSIFCILNALPHFIYGSGSDALSLTLEYGSGSNQHNLTTKSNTNLCAEKENKECMSEDISLVPPLILFISQLIAGLGSSLYHTLTFSYMDDNVQKSKSPALMSIIHFIRMFGPAMGFGIVSICLKFYINPTLTPTITNADPRWLGAWWLGWILLGVVNFISGSVIAQFPKTMPRAAVRRVFLKQKNKLMVDEEKCNTSVRDMWQTLKRLLGNKVYMYATMASIFFVFGYNPFWTYLPKYIEVQYNRTASEASFFTGSTSLVFVGIGILSGGILVQKWKPSGRLTVIFNTFSDSAFFVGVVAYSFLGCDGVDGQINTLQTDSASLLNATCNANCQCDYVNFSPVCSLETLQTFITPCHAGCTDQLNTDNGTIYTNCSCIIPPSGNFTFGSAVSGICHIDCQKPFIAFMIVSSVVKMIGAMSRVTIFLVIVRSVREQDKAVAIGFQMTIIALFSFIPSPIFFGYIIDSTCLIWGKTCTRNGNCWFYDTALMRKDMTFYAALFLFIGLIFDIFTYRNSKNLKIFDEINKSKDDD